MNGWAALHSLRLAATSGRSCSAARSAFFKRQAQTLGRVPHRAGAELDPCSAFSQACACASVMPGRERMCAASANSCSGESLRGGWPRLGLIPASPVSRRRISAL